MTNKEYVEYLKDLDEMYSSFMNTAKKIIPEDITPKMESLKSRSVLEHIKLRAMLQKFRKSSCGCEFKGNE